MRNRFLTALRRYGDTISIGGETMRAFLSPVRRTGEHGYGSLPTALGTAPSEEYLYLGDPAVALTEGDWLDWQGRTLRVTQSKLVGAGDEPIYCWATLKAVAA